MGDALGLIKMTDALEVTDVKYQQVDQDVLAIGYLPPSKSILHVAEEAYARRKPPQEEASGSNKESQQGEEEEEEEVKFYKAWNQYGLLSNFSCVPLKIDDRYDDDDDDDDILRKKAHTHCLSRFYSTPSIKI